MSIQRQYDNMEPKDGPYDFHQEKNTIENEMIDSLASEKAAELIKKLAFWIFPNEDQNDLLISKEARIELITVALADIISDRSYFK